MNAAPVARIAVVIPTRDRPAIVDAVGNVLAQGDDDVEIVVVDDGSTVPAADRLGPLADRVRIVRLERSVGPAAARNAGVAATGAELVAFLDDDDEWLPGKLARCRAVLAAHPHVDVVAHPTRFSADRRGTGAVEVVDRPVERMVTTQPPHLDGVLVRRAVHERVRFDPDFEAAEDLDYLIRLAGVATFAFVDETLAVFGPADRAPSTIGLQRRIDARRLLARRHRAAMGRRGLAFHRMRLGHLYRRAGRRGAAARSFLAAGATNPRLAEAWRGLVLVGLPGAVRDRVVRRSRDTG